MKRIGDVLTTLSIPVGPAKSNGAAKSAPAWRCPVCKDAGWVRMEVPVGHPHFGRLFPCECKVAEQAERGRDRLRQVSNLEAFADYTFENFKPEEGTEAARDASLTYAQDPSGWLYLHGPVGSGKTHLAVATALEISKRNANVLFAVVPDLLDHLRTTFDPNQTVSYDERFNAIRNSFLLVLDDLGTENTTPWAKEKLFQIFNHRYVEKLPTIVTSNKRHEDIDERIRSRLLDTRSTTEVFVSAEDFRLRGRKNYVRSRRARGSSNF